MLLENTGRETTDEVAPMNPNHRFYPGTRIRTYQCVMSVPRVGDTDSWSVYRLTVLEDVQEYRAYLRNTHGLTVPTFDGLDDRTALSGSTASVK